MYILKGYIFFCNTLKCYVYGNIYMYVIFNVTSFKKKNWLVVCLLKSVTK